jgi:hypothetical protein
MEILMKTIVLLALSTILVSIVHSQSMTIHFRDGRTASYSLSEIEKITYSLDQLSGKWSGRLTTDDPSVGRRAEYSLKIDFDKLTARSSNCGYERVVGTINIRSSSTIEISWPDCGFETVTYSFRSGVLTASGSMRAYSGGRIIPTDWELTRQ